MDSALKLCNIKNIVVVPNKEAKANFLDTVYPHYIDCIVLTASEAPSYVGKFIFFGCYVEELSKYENIVMDDIIYSNWEPQPYRTKWTPQSLASFMAHWFAQDKLRKMHNNLNWRFENGKPTDGRDEWLSKIMY